MKPKTLLVVVGPTAIGKTKLAIALATHVDTEIISADSRQFYQEMEVGTAVPSESELAAVKHHFIQHKSIHDTYTVGDFEKDAITLLEKLFKKKDIVVMVGGSGLYVDSVVKGLDEFPEVAENIRHELNEQLENEGIKSLQEELKTVDPEYYERVDLENPHRIIRALEVFRASGNPYSSFIKQEKKKRQFKTIYIGITASRDVIYQRINDRVDLMMDNGLLEEVKSLINYKALNALNTVGYKELFAYFEGETTFDFAIAEIKKNTRRFAKRQLTWYRKNEEIFWVDYQEPVENVLDSIEKRIAND